MGLEAVREGQRGQGLDQGAGALLGEVLVSRQGGQRVGRWNCVILRTGFLAKNNLKKIHTHMGLKEELNQM